MKNAGISRRFLWSQETANYLMLASAFSAAAL